MSFEGGDGAEELGAEVKAKFNQAAEAFMGKATGKGARTEKIGDAILRELGDAVKSDDTAGQAEMEGALTNFAQTIGGEAEASNMIGFLHPKEKDK